MLLPLASEPFTVPPDRDMLPGERREFVRTHRTCVFGYGRLHDGPAMSVVYYVPTDDDELLISTMAARGKAQAVGRNAKVSLCVLDERWPFAYLQVYADAVVDQDPQLVVDVMMAVAWRMTGQQLNDDARPMVAARAAEEGRVVVRCRPYATFAQPSRHLERSDEQQAVTHWASSTIPWEASDPSWVGDAAGA
jgi:Pyridoxamine 5'-phosphate oxidase